MSVVQLLRASPHVDTTYTIFSINQDYLVNPLIGLTSRPTCPCNQPTCVFEWDTFMCRFHGCYHGRYTTVHTHLSTLPTLPPTYTSVVLFWSPARLQIQHLTYIINTIVLGQTSLSTDIYIINTIVLGLGQTSLSTDIYILMRPPPLP